MKELELDRIQAIAGGQDQHLYNPIEDLYCQYVVPTFLSNPILNIALFEQYNACIANGYGGQ